MSTFALHAVGVSLHFASVQRSQWMCLYAGHAMHNVTVRRWPQGHVLLYSYNPGLLMARLVSHSRACATAPGFARWVCRLK